MITENCLLALTSHNLTSIYVDKLARDIGAVLGSEEYISRCDFTRLAGSA